MSSSLFIRTLCLTFALTGGLGILARAEKPEEQRFLRVGITLVPLIRWTSPTLKLSIETSPRCTEPKPCEALTGLLRIRQKHSLPAQLSASGGKNPGSVLCQEILHGEVILGRDLEGNTDSLCRFKDGSFTACSSLSAVMVKYW
jgi:hypothetical protein